MATAAPLPRFWTHSADGAGGVQMAYAVRGGFMHAALVALGVLLLAGGCAAGRLRVAARQGPPLYQNLMPAGLAGVGPPGTAGAGRRTVAAAGLSALGLAVSGAGLSATSGAAGARR